MNIKKKRRLSISMLAAVIVLTACSKDDDNGPIDPPVIPPSEISITLTQLDVSLSELSAVVPNMRITNSEESNVTKTTFVGGDFFQFTYHAPENGIQTAFAHTSDGKSWTFRKTVDTSSAIQPIQLATDKAEIMAIYLPLSAGATTDGIILNADNTVICYDALQATANATVSGEKAKVSLHFKHINHLLRFGIEGDISTADVNSLLLSLAYTDNSGKAVTAVLKTSLLTEYTPTTGAKQTIIQAIVPREAVLKKVTAILASGESLVVNNSENLPADLVCPGGKSRLITLRMNNGVLTLQPSDIATGWVDGGTLHSNDELTGDIYIRNATDLKTFRDAVNANPGSSAARMNGIIAYTANVIQTANIDLSGEDWTPIGGKIYNDDFDVTYFTGTYNGNGYTISNMKVTSTTVTGNGASYYGGLFGWVKSPRNKQAVLTGIHLRNASVIVNLNVYALYVGALVGIVGETTQAQRSVVISLCSATGSVSATNANAQIEAGGLIGNTQYTHTTRCTVNVPVTINDSRNASAGGIIGSANNSIIASCYAQGAIAIQTTTTANGGGIVGDLHEDQASSLIMACRADGNIHAIGATVNTGGLAGVTNGTLVGSFAKGTVTGDASDTGYIGALIGNNFSPSQLALCYGASANDAGSSRNANPATYNITYKTAPSAGEIFSVVNGSAWANANGGHHKQEAIYGGLLTPINIFASEHYSITTQSRLWVLFDTNSPWSNTVQGGTNVYPVPVMSYVGQ